ncbi:putative GTPase, probable translation factor [Methanomethylovorans hollandica DSM 15978]|jgi:ribosome-binding ATPase YchF (GTP1/OBG family)|uniref:Putative GTPase, probable translation factor n=1 Tax=Methanomethylovorans hollandica (strain DSM 15978 / NBRC 107637 / DMS1) TaxID=867904 RepID=L0KSK2_METHD|nr:redox-regulated ATPase YchF [Methanomethylovorans hollandica]AGB48392.1 putative GTPase, probable translation factor [Methanomethylovorans hollandica DSM 15978]
MSMTIGLAGKPNSGKSTFFKASTLADVEIANYPFTTIHPNKGVTYVRVRCPCMERDHRCGNCVEGVRYVPIELIDVAGLVPGAHMGKGLGNTFLDDLRQAQAIIHVIDAAGCTDIEGNPIDIGCHDPVEDVEFLNHEITMWMVGILKRNWQKVSRKVQGENLKIERVLAEQLAGAGVEEPQVIESLLMTKLDHNISKWTDEEIIDLCDKIRMISKPMIIAANKADIAPVQNLEKLKEAGRFVVSTSAAAELALRSASKTGAIKYDLGESDFSIITQDLSPAQQKALDSIRSFLHKMHNTGIQECINKAVFELLDLIVVYPVEDEGKWTDKQGRMLPDAFLMKRGSNAHQLAFKVHSDIGEGFLYAVDAKTKMRLGEKHELENGSVVKIVSTAK